MGAALALRRHACRQPVGCTILMAAYYAEIVPRQVMSVRVSVEVRGRLEREAERSGEPPASLAERLIEEGLRLRRHPLIRFVDGPTGRRARMVPGPDVWEAVSFVQRSEAEGEDKVAHASEWLGVPALHVEAALAYYAAFPDEIDQRIKLNTEALAEAEAISLGRRRLLA